MTEQKTHQISNQFFEIQERISKSVKLSNRKIEDVKLIVVTKNQPVEKIIEVIQAGAIHIGENYPDETWNKTEQLKNFQKLGLKIHLIGHLQSRKIPLMIKQYDVFHALDSIRLAEKINNRIISENLGPFPTLLQFNVSGEIEKFGWNASIEKKWPEFCDDFETLLGYKGIKLIGLMTMPPLLLDSSNNRAYFDRLRRLKLFFESRYPEISLPELSMGTSQDFESAILEGATYVRIGTKIMGSRIKEIEGNRI